ncbi:Ribonuclease H [Madurella mycetomatis]|uniref:ribonuclease H n=1 Tax=Madurella mycetomatis TaxID=100816 RepID=A0A175WE86_9PEZI|nr:Ribonuclease H [Madurella mycetomatis]
MDPISKSVVDAGRRHIFYANERGERFNITAVHRMNMHYLRKRIMDETASILNQGSMDDENSKTLTSLIQDYCTAAKDRELMRDWAYRDWDNNPFHLKAERPMERDLFNHLKSIGIQPERVRSIPSVEDSLMPDLPGGPWDYPSATRTRRQRYALAILGGVILNAPMILMVLIPKFANYTRPNDPDPMPLGWYLAQGLMPLTASSSDDEEGPYYSFMEEVLSRDGQDEDENEDDDGDHPGSEIEATDLDLAADGSNTTGPDAPRSNSSSISLGPRLRRGTGRAFPTKYTLRNDAGKVLIRTDGACVDNGQPSPKAGWAFWHGFGPSGNLVVASGRLEKEGPFGDDSIQSSNRAELRAVIAALRFRHWHGEGFHTLVIATDSEYAVEGSTKWAKTWIKNRWIRRAGDGVKNRDLWEALLGEIERYKDEGMAVERLPPR